MNDHEIELLRLFVMTKDVYYIGPGSVQRHKNNKVTSVRPDLTEPGPVAALARGYVVALDNATLDDFVIVESLSAYRKYTDKRQKEDSSFESGVGRNYDWAE